MAVTAINGSLMRLEHRAERIDPSTLVETFVDVGPLFHLLNSGGHQIVYGRRGTGKTHALQYLIADRRRAGDVAVYVDMRTIGSTGGIYGDQSIPLGERGPPAGRSRRRGLGGSPSTRTKARNGAGPWQRAAERKRGVLVAGGVRPIRRVSGPRYDSSVDLVVGAGKLDRTLQDVEALVEAYRTDDGLRYLDYQPLTPSDRMVPEDLAVTILINSRVAGAAFKAVQDHGHEVALDALLPAPSRTPTRDSARRSAMSSARWSRGRGLPPP
jgi:hypothetical protein